MGGRVFLLNALITPFKDDEAVFRIRRIDEGEARRVVEGAREVVSALGHQASVEAFNALGIPGASLNRIQVFFEVGDKAIALVLRARLPEGAVVSYEMMRSIGYDLYLIERIE